MNLEFDRPREQLELMAQMYLDAVMALLCCRAYGDDPGETAAEIIAQYDQAKMAGRI